MPGWQIDSVGPAREAPGNWGEGLALSTVSPWRPHLQAVLILASSSLLRSWTREKHDTHSFSAILQNIKAGTVKAIFCYYNTLPKTKPFIRQRNLFDLIHLEVRMSKEMYPASAQTWARASCCIIIWWRSLPAILKRDGLHKPFAHSSLWLSMLPQEGRCLTVPLPPIKSCCQETRLYTGLT